MFRRRRSKKTDYRQRMALLKSGLPRLVVRRSLKYIHVQVASFEEGGDKIILEASSKSLAKFGWPGDKANVPAAYLTGLLAGLKARKNGVQGAVLDIGLQTSISGSCIYSVVKGAMDGGLKIPAGKDALPPEGRISGRHISDYAARLRKENAEQYKKQFSSYLKSGTDPEKLHEMFADVKQKIIEEFGAEAKKLAIPSS